MINSKSLCPHSEQTYMLREKLSCLVISTLTLMEILTIHRYDDVLNLSYLHLTSIILLTRIERICTLMDNICTTSNFTNDCAGIPTNKMANHILMSLIRRKIKT